MTMWFHSRRTLFVAAPLTALTLWGCNVGPAPTPPADAIKALVYGPVASAYLGPLKPTLELTTYTGSQKLADYQMLIFDGDAHPADALKNDELVKTALRSGMLVLGVDLTEAHKKVGLGDVLNAATCGNSPAYAMRVVQDRNGRPAVQIMEDGGTVTDGFTRSTGGSGGPQKPGPAPEHPQRPEVRPCDAAVAAQSTPSRPASAAFTKLLLERVRGAKGGVRPLDDPPPSIPADLIYTTYYFTDTASLVNDCSLRGYCDKGPQTTALTVNYTYYVFLNNKNNAQGDFQFVLLESDVSVIAAQNGKFVNMFGHDGTDWTCCFYDEVSNFTGGIWNNTSPGVPAGAWVLQDSSPETVNNTTQVTDGVSFSIGFTGQDPSASFTYSNSVTRNIQDWAVDNQASSPYAAWWFRSQYPFNADIGFDCNSDQDIWVGLCYLQSPNDLSLNTAQFHTQALWRTQAVEDGWVTMYTSTGMRVLALACVRNGGAGCWTDGSSYADVTAPGTHQINMGAVLPIPIQSLTFSPGSTVKGGTPVTATLTLAQPAAVDTTISLSSDQTNASVPPSVTVKQGQTSASFQILTNANGIAPGGQLVATIKAFYAEFFQAQLTLTN